MRRIRVVRHGLGMRILHWLIVFEGVVLGLTGMQLGGIWGVRIFPDGGVWAIHVLMGLAWIATSFALVAYMILSGDYRWYSLSRVPYGLKYLLLEARHWLSGGSMAVEPIKFDNENERYVEKLIPTEILVWWVFIFIGALIMVTGLSLAFRDQLSFILDIFGLLTPILGGGPYSITRSIHLLMMYLVLGIFIIHVYAVFVFRMVRSIIFGDREEPVA